jgi:hypothetical protein
MAQFQIKIGLTTKNQLKKVYKFDNILDFLKSKFNLKHINKNTLFPVCYAGLFAVKKNVILENSIDFYSNINNILISESNKIDGKTIDFGLFLEKLWLVIFNYKKHNKNYIELKYKNYKTIKANLKIKNNEINFKFNMITYQLYCDLVINNDKFYIFITRSVAVIKKNDNKIIKKNFQYKSKTIKNVYFWLFHLQEIFKRVCKSEILTK